MPPSYEITCNKCKENFWIRSYPDHCPHCKENYLNIASNVQMEKMFIYSEAKASLGQPDISS